MNMNQGMNNVATYTFCDAIDGCRWLVSSGGMIDEDGLVVEMPDNVSDQVIHQCPRWLLMQR